MTRSANAARQMTRFTAAFALIILIAMAAPADAQRTARIAAVTWTPMPVIPVPTSLAVGDRILVLHSEQFSVLERFSSASGAPQWRLVDVFCHTSLGVCHLNWSGGDFRILPPQAQVQALISFDPGESRNIIFNVQYVGTLAKARGVSGAQQAHVDFNQVLSLDRGRALRGGSYLDLIGSDGRVITSFDRGVQVLWDPQGRVAVLEEIGYSEADNWGCTLELKQLPKLK